MEEYLHCNRSIAQAIDILQGDKDTSYGYLLPTLVTIRSKLHHCKNFKFVHCQHLIKAIEKSLATRFADFFNVVGAGRVCAVASATHPKFKLDWMKSLSSTAQSNVIDALKEALAENNPPPLIEEHELEENDGFFEFANYSDNQNNENQPEVVMQMFGATDPEVMYQQFLANGSRNLSLLDQFPAIKQIFIKFNTPLPSSASVERLFSYATMFNLPKFNRLTDTNFESRVVMKCNSSAAKSKK